MTKKTDIMLLRLARVGDRKRMLTSLTGTLATTLLAVDHRADNVTGISNQILAFKARPQIGERSCKSLQFG